jgi:type VI secretion system secreted protein VgrG
MKAMTMKDYEIKTSSPAGSKISRFWQIMGHEALSMPSVYELTFLSASDDIRKKDILGHFFEVVIPFEDKNGATHERKCHGHAVRLKFNSEEKIDGQFVYKISLVSWFGLLIQRTNSRIEQDMTIKEIFDCLLEEAPINQVKNIAEKINLKGTHDKRRYCVQFNESDYHFLARLLDDEGIYYWFDSHKTPGAMYLSDDSASGHEPLPVTGTLRYREIRSGDARHNEIIEWEGANEFSAGIYASTDNNFKEVRSSLLGKELVPNELELGDFEQFEFPGDHFDQNKASDKRKLRAEKLASKRDRHWAVTEWPDVAVGHTFNFEGHRDAIKNKPYLISSCTFFVRNTESAGTPASANSQVPVSHVLGEFLQQYGFHKEFLKDVRSFLLGAQAIGPARPGTRTFVLSVLPPQVEQAPVPFRPIIPILKPTMPGPQTAIVVGPAGDELHVDKMGRVKVQFHWDRKYHKNEKATAWIRVSQPWAGQNWGAYFIPRIGQEVIVDFLNGDPDRPIIVGRVYNDNQPIPYHSPTQSGIKTRSTPNGSPSNYNEIMFEDKIGSEKLNIQAEKNMSRTVKWDDGSSVGNDQSDSVKHDRKSYVGHNETNTVKEMQSNFVGTMQSNVIGTGGQTSHIKGPQNNFLHDAQTTVVLKEQILSVHQNQNTTVQGFQKINVGMNQDLAITGYQTTHVGLDHAIVVSGKTKIHAKGEARFISNENRFDITNSKHAVMANQIDLVAASEMNMSVVGKINATSVESNTTVLGNNSSGYIGSSSSANLGMARSTFMGLGMSNALGLSMNNFLGLQLENNIALKLVGTGGLEITGVPISIDDDAMKIFKTGVGSSGGGPGAAAKGAWSAFNTAGAVGGLVSLVAGGFSVVSDTLDTFDQYKKAIAQIKDASKMAKAEGLTALEARLDGMAELAQSRLTEGHVIAAGVPLAIAAAPVLAVVPAVGVAALIVGDQHLANTAENLTESGGSNTTTMGEDYNPGGDRAIEGPEAAKPDLPPVAPDMPSPPPGFGD